MRNGPEIRWAEVRRPTLDALLSLGSALRSRVHILDSETVYLKHKLRIEVTYKVLFSLICEWNTYNLGIVSQSLQEVSLSYTELFPESEPSNSSLPPQT